MKVLLAIFLLFSSSMYAQKVAYIASAPIRERWIEMQQAQQRIQSLVDDWKREIADLQKQCDDMSQELVKNRLVWSAEERTEMEQQLAKKRQQREELAKKKFEPNGEYDQQASAILKPVEEKLFTAVQDVSAAEGFDIVLDKTTQPIVYVNPKYDLTVKVMKKLNIPAEDLEEKQKKAIEEDPRNKKVETPTMPRKKSRGSSSTTESSEPSTDSKEIPR